MSGKLIVFEGGDGSGKATQTELLVSALSKRTIPVQTISFPRYDAFYGASIKKFLSGAYGSFESIPPQLMAIVYAADRRDARDTITSWLADECVVIADRYIASNQAHQAAKLPEDRQDDLIAWIEEMEYRVNALPKPDLTLYLHVPAADALKLIADRETDIAEKIEHQKKTEAVYKKLTAHDGMQTVECMTDGVLRSPEDIHREILEHVHAILDTWI